MNKAPVFEPAKEGDVLPEGIWLPNRAERRALKKMKKFRGQHRYYRRLKVGTPAVHRKMDEWIQAKFILRFHSSFFRSKN